MIQALLNKSMLPLLLTLALAGNAGAGTVGLWLFDEVSGTQSLDFSDNANTATLIGAPNDPWWVNGRYGGGVGYDANDAIRIEDSDSLDASSGLTVEGWINFNGAASNGEFVDKWPLGNRSYVLSIWGAASGNPKLVGRIQKADNSGQIDFFGSNVIASDTWNHIAFTYDGATGVGRLYINGVAETPAPDPAGYTGNIHVDTAPVYIGNGNSMGTIAGASFDEIRISDTALPGGSGSGVNELAWNTTLNPDGGMLMPLTAGWTLLASGAADTVTWSACKIKKDGGLYTVSAAATSGWIEPELYYFDTATQAYKATPTDDIYLHGDRGYWLWSHISGLELLIPF